MELENMDEETLIYTDEKRLMQVILCLQSNALKFTSRGYVKIIACLEHISEHVDNLKIIVEDTGIGIREENKGKIFKLFG